MTPYPTVAPVSGVEQQSGDLLSALQGMLQQLEESGFSQSLQRIDGREVWIFEESAQARIDYARAAIAVYLASQSQAVQPSDIIQELLDAYEQVTNSAYCQVSQDEELIERARAALAVQSQAAPVAEAVPEALRLLEILFDRWENGIPCYEGDEDGGSFIGNAFRLDEETFNACANLLNNHSTPTTQEVTQQAAPDETAEQASEQVPGIAYPTTYDDLARITPAALWNRWLGDRSPSSISPRDAFIAARSVIAPTTSTVSAPDEQNSPGGDAAAGREEFRAWYCKTFGYRIQDMTDGYMLETTAWKAWCEAIRRSNRAQTATGNKEQA